MSEIVDKTNLPYTFAPVIEDFVAGRRSTSRKVGDPIVDRDVMKRGDANGRVREAAVPMAPQDPNDFEQEAIARIRKVRETLSAMLEAGGKPIIKTRDVQKYFGVDPRLSWQIYKLSTTDDLLSAAQYVPPSVSMLKVVSAARTQGIADSFIRPAEEAFQHFETFVELHAGDRMRFESMVSALARGEDAQQAALQQRKALFRAHSYFWGVELTTSYGINMFGPPRSGKETCDFVYLMNLIGFNRLRPNADTHVMGVNFRSKEHTVGREALDREASARLGAPVIPPFSNRAVSLLKTAVDEFGATRTKLTGNNVGLTHSVDIAFGEIIRDAASFPGSTLANATSRPTMRMCMEMLLHRQIYPVMEISATTFGHMTLNTPQAELYDPRMQLTLHEKPVLIRAGENADLPAVPHRAELIEYVCKKLQWNASEFDTYRLEIEYPILDTATVMELSHPSTE